MWRIKDFVINTLLSIRLWFYIKFRPNKLIIINEIEKDGWVLTFNDEFDDAKLDRNKWLPKPYYGYNFHPGNIYNDNKAPDMYLNEDYNIIENGILKQKATNIPKEVHHIDWNGKDWGKWTIPYQCGSIDSSISFEQKYGYFEIRSKQPNQPGHWTAFWLASVHAWPPEIDIYEIYTGKEKNKGFKSFNSNFHWLPQPNKKDKVKTHSTLNNANEFHTYAVEWDPKYFKIYYNNLLVRPYTNPETLKEFKYPMHIIINNGIDVGVGRNADKAVFPTYHEVDYIRAYKRKC